MGATIGDLNAAIERGQEYFLRGAPMDVAFVRGPLREVLRAVIGDVKREFISEHDLGSDEA